MSSVSQPLGSLQCRCFLRLLEKSHVEISRRQEEMGRVKGSGDGGGEREEKMPARKHCENEKHPLISCA